MSHAICVSCSIINLAKVSYAIGVSSLFAYYEKEKYMEENILKLKETLDIIKKYSNNPIIAQKVCNNLQSCGYELEKVINDLEECKDTLDI